MNFKWTPLVLFFALFMTVINIAVADIFTECVRQNNCAEVIRASAGVRPYDGPTNIKADPRDAEIAAKAREFDAEVNPPPSPYEVRDE